MRRYIEAIIMALALIALVPSLVGIALVHHEGVQRQKELSKRDAALATAIRDTVCRADRSVDGFVGRIPGYTTRDADNAHAANRATLRSFGAKPCQQRQHPIKG